MKFFLLFAYLIIHPLLALAQVVTPQMDPQFPTVSGAALPWRNIKTLSVGGIIEKGSKDNVEIEARDYSTSGVRALSNVKFQELSVQALYESTKQKEDSGNFATKNEKINILMGHQFTNNLTLGFDAKKHETLAEEAYLNSWRSETDSNFNSTLLKGAGSFSYRLSKVIYLGSRLGIVKNEHNKRVENTWLEREIGLAFISGGSGVRWRMEAYWHHSARRKQKKSGDLMINHHPETDLYAAVIDIGNGASAVTFGWERQIEKAPTENTYDITTSKLIIGYSDSLWFKNLIGALHVIKYKNYDRFFSKNSYNVFSGITLKF